MIEFEPCLLKKNIEVQDSFNPGLALIGGPATDFLEEKTLSSNYFLRDENIEQINIGCRGQTFEEKLFFRG